MTTPTADRVAILQQGKVTIGAHVDRVTANSVDAYVRAWASVRQDLVSAAAEAARVAAATGNPRNPAAYRTARLNKVLAELTGQLQRLGMRTGVQVTNVVPDVMAVPQQVLEDLDPAGLGGLNRVPARELEAIIRRQQEKIASQYLQLSVEAEQSLRDALLRGVARGSGTDAVARDMVRTAQAGAARRLGISSAAELDAAPAGIVAQVRDAFAGGMQRAQVLARTELIDASRVATTATYLAAPGVVAGWVWMATLDRRTCGACWAMHGKVFAPDVHLEGHQQCRCVQSPLLHGERPEDAGLANAEERFHQLSRADQLAVLGPKRLELVELGRASLSDMATRRDNPGWRAGHYVTPLDQLGGGVAGPRRVPRAPVDDVAPPAPAHDPHPGISALPRQNKPLTGPATKAALVKQAEATNPLYGTDRQYGNNCVHVVAAHELRRRGFDVQATALPKVGKDAGPWVGHNGRNAEEAVARWRTPDGDKAQLQDLTRKQLNDTLEALPVGARGWVRIRWGRDYGGGGHIVNVERTAEGVVWVEAQQGILKQPHRYTARAATTKGALAFVRVDELVPTDAVLPLVKPAGS